MKRHVLTVLAVAGAVVLLAWAQAGAQQQAMASQNTPQVSLKDINAKLDDIALWAKYASVLAGLALLSSLWNAHHLYIVAKNQVVAAKAMAEKP
jgi:hypothetical protein